VVFVVDKVALGQIFSAVPKVPPHKLKKKELSQAKVA
jgi:hypothetical protein